MKKSETGSCQKISVNLIQPSGRAGSVSFDMSAVTEAIVNAFVHNDWTKSRPLFCIFKDRLEIFSHGGLPAGQTKEDFFKGISCPRNDALMRIFNNMHISEHTGHGIPLIVRKYGKRPLILLTTILTSQYPLIRKY